MNKFEWYHPTKFTYTYGQVKQALIDLGFVIGFTPAAREGKSSFTTFSYYFPDEIIEDNEPHIYFCYSSYHKDDEIFPEDEWIRYSKTLREFELIS